MFLRRLAPLFLLTAFALPAAAQEVPEPAEPQRLLFEALDLSQVLDIMRREGIEYAAELASESFPGRGGDSWRETVEAIYDIDWMTQTVTAGLAAALEGADIAAMIGFFTSAPGETIVKLETSAREALLDKAVEEEAQEAAAVAIYDHTERVQLLEELVEVNDLIENNVVGALNSNYAFYLGLLDGNAFPYPLSQDQVLAEVWMQEAEIRADTAQWLYAYLLMAYQPLLDAEVEAYIAFSRSEAGQALNRASFEAFNAMQDEVSRALGRATARYMIMQQL